MVAPSDAFARSLPGGKVPDRSDFETLPTEERVARWHDVTERCRALADDFLGMIESGTLSERVQPFA